MAPLMLRFHYSFYGANALEQGVPIATLREHVPSIVRLNHTSDRV